MNYDFKFDEYDENRNTQSATVKFGDVVFSLSFDKGDVTEIQTDDGDYINIESCHKFFVKDGFKICNLKRMIQHIEENFQEYAQIELDDIASEEEMRQELSYPWENA